MRRAAKRFSLTFVILASGSSPTGLWMTAPAYFPHPEYAGASEEAKQVSDPDSPKSFPSKPCLFRRGLGLASRRCAERSRTCWWCPGSMSLSLTWADALRTIGYNDPRQQGREGERPSRASETLACRPASCCRCWCRNRSTPAAWISERKLTKSCRLRRRRLTDHAITTSAMVWSSVETRR